MNLPLNIFYRHLKNTILIAKKKLFQNSILLGLIKTNSNTRYSLLKESNIPGHKIRRDEKDILIKEKLIKESAETAGYYVLTPLGIYTVEKDKNILNESKLLSFIDKTYFSKLDIPKHRIKDHERIALLALLAIRVFSKDCWMDLKSNEKLILDAWLEIFSAARDFLLENRLLTKNIEITRDRERKSILGVMARCNDLKKYTHNIYSWDGDRHYWLEIGETLKDKSNTKVILGTLLKLIIKGKEIDSNLLDELNDFCHRVAHKYIPIVLKSTKYLDVDYDEIMNDSVDYLLEI